MADKTQTIEARPVKVQIGSGTERVSVEKFTIIDNDSRVVLVVDGLGYAPGTYGLVRYPDDED